MPRMICDTYTAHVSAQPGTFDQDVTLTGVAELTRVLELVKVVGLPPPGYATAETAPALAEAMEASVRWIREHDVLGMAEAMEASVRWIREHDVLGIVEE